MKVVKVEILPAKDGEVVTAVITEETKKGGSWKEGVKNTVQSGTPEASRSMLLDDDDRVIIEGKVEGEIVLDPEQRSAKQVFRGEKREAQEKKDKEQQEKFDKMNKEEKERLEREKPQEAKLREEQEKARNEKIMGKQESQKEPQDKTEEDTAGRARAEKREGPFATQAGGDHEAGLREDIPKDSKSVKDEAQGSTTKPRGR